MSFGRKSTCGYSGFIVLIRKVCSAKRWAFLYCTAWKQVGFSPDGGRKHQGARRRAKPRNLLAQPGIPTPAGSQSSPIVIADRILPTYLRVCEKVVRFGVIPCLSPRLRIGCVPLPPGDTVR